MVNYAPAREYQPAGDGEMQESVREAIAAIGMPDLDVTGETRWGTPPVWLLWLPGMGVPPNESLGRRGLVAVLGDGSDGYVYADLAFLCGLDGMGDSGWRRGSDVRFPNAGDPRCPGSLWNTAYPRTPHGMADLAADVTEMRRVLEGR